MKTYWGLFLAGFLVYFFGFLQFNNITPNFMLLGTGIFVIALYEWYRDETKPKPTKKERKKSGNVN
jgi:4-hydroxybenzoate polyprenyltransferase